jgi:hypothetical protein
MTLLRVEGIVAELVYDGNVDWDGATFPAGQQVLIEVGDADLERAKAIVEAAG